MASVPQSFEEQLVASREQAQQAKFASRRTKSVVLAIFGGLLCAASIGFGLWMFAVCALFVALIGISNYFAANGHLHHLQRREKHRKRLVRDFSKLEPDEPTGHGSRAANPSGAPTPSS